MTKIPALFLVAVLAVPAAASSRDRVIAGEERLADLLSAIFHEHDLVSDAFKNGGFAHPYFEAELHLEMMQQEVHTTSIVAALEKDDQQALDVIKEGELEIGGKLASFRAVVSPHLKDPDAVERGLKAIFNAEAEASKIKSHMIEQTQGNQRAPVVIEPDGAKGLRLKVFAPKAMPPAAVHDAIAKAKVTLPVAVGDFETARP